jgi:hypothetical protein
VDHKVTTSTNVSRCSTQTNLHSEIKSKSDNILTKDRADANLDIRSKDIGGVQYPRFKPAFGVDGVATDVSASDPLPVTVANFPGSQAVTGPLTDTQLRASAVPARIASYAYPISTNNSSTAQLAAGATSANTALTVGLTRMSIVALCEHIALRTLGSL